jgi:hypothetical protein
MEAGVRKVENLFRDMGELRLISVEATEDGRHLITVDGPHNRWEILANLTTLSWLATTLNKYLEVKP